MLVAVAFSRKSLGNAFPRCGQGRDGVLRVLFYDLLENWGNPSPRFLSIACIHEWLLQRRSYCMSSNSLTTLSYTTRQSIGLDTCEESSCGTRRVALGSAVG